MKDNPLITSNAPGVTDNFPKYSGERNYSIGSPNGKGRVKSAEFDDHEWSESDVQKTGLISRNPI